MIQYQAIKNRKEYRIPDGTMVRMQTEIRCLNFQEQLALLAWMANEQLEQYGIGGTDAEKALRAKHPASDASVVDLEQGELLAYLNVAVAALASALDLAPPPIPEKEGES